MSGVHLVGKVKSVVRTRLRQSGWNLVRFDPCAVLDTFVPLVIKQTSVNVVVDVGANVGGFGAMIRRGGYEGRILSFEPDSKNFAILNRNLRGDPLWSAHRLGLGSSEGSLPMFAGATVFSSFRRPTAFGLREFSDMAQAGEQDVAVSRLDSVFSQLANGVAEPRIFLKSDTQGWDVEVLKGAAEILPQVVAIQMEMSIVPLYEEAPNWQSSAEYLRDLGFVFAGIFPVVRDKSLRLLEFDAVLIRE